LIFTAAFIVYAWRKREMLGSLSFMLWMVAISGWLLINLINIMLIVGKAHVDLYRFILLFQGLLPGSFLLFTLHFTGQHRWVRSWRQVLLFIFPLIIVYFGWTHPFTELLWNNFQVISTGLGTYTYGWLYLLFWFYFYICLFSSVLIFVKFMRSRGVFYQDQIKLILISALLPTLSVAVSVFWPSPIMINHILPISFSGSGLLVGFGIYKYGLFDLSMITYHTLLENFRDGLIIFDQKFRLIFANLASEQLLDFDSKQQIGKHITHFVSEVSVWFPVLMGGLSEAIILTETGEIHYEVEQVFLPIHNDSWKQKLIIIRDVTPAYEAEQAEKEARTIAENRAMELDVLRIIAEKLNRLVDFERVTQDGLQEIVSRLGARFGYIVLADKHLRPYLAGSYNLPVTAEAAFKKYTFCPTCKNFEKFMNGDYQEPVSFLPCAVLDKFSISYPGLLSIPLRLAERQIGVLNLVMSPNAVFSGDEIRLLQTIGDQYSAAIERARLYEEAERMATLDALTELFNRRYFFELAHQEFERACRYKHPISVIMLDIDLFKNVNDTYGHLVGDQVLKTIAERCQSVLRSSDKIGRYGGEEFVIILPETSIEMAVKTANRIRMIVSDRPILVENAKISTTVSLGVSSMNAECNLTLEQVLDQADQALYRAKQSGRNRVYMWSDPYVMNGLFSKNKTDLP
jgi:diguanylate cyclase (GGDEF)-like protein